MSISNLAFSLPIFLALASLSCTKETFEPQTQRTTLGPIHVAVISSLPNQVDIQFRGRVVETGTSETFFDVPGVGRFKNFVSLRDTLTADTARIYYTLPTGEALKVDGTSRTVLIYKRNDTRIALILKSKNDSLIAMVNTLLPSELDTIIAKAGEQAFHVAVGSELYISRNTPCGREGDYNTTFSSTAGSTTVPPGRTGLLQTGDKVYSVSNVLNTQIIKDFETCPDFRPAFAFMIILQ